MMLPHVIRRAGGPRAATNRFGFEFLQKEYERQARCLIGVSSTPNRPAHRSAASPRQGEVECGWDCIFGGGRRSFRGWTGGGRPWAGGGSRAAARAYSRRTRHHNITAQPSTLRSRPRERQCGLKCSLYGARVLVARLLGSRTSLGGGRRAQIDQIAVSSLSDVQCHC